MNFCSGNLVFICELHHIVGSSEGLNDSKIITWKNVELKIQGSNFSASRTMAEVISIKKVCMFYFRIAISKPISLAKTNK